MQIIWVIINTTIVVFYFLIFIFRFSFWFEFSVQNKILFLICCILTSDKKYSCFVVKCLYLLEVLDTCVISFKTGIQLQIRGLVKVKAILWKRLNPRNLALSGIVSQDKSFSSLIWLVKCRVPALLLCTGPVPIEHGQFVLNCGGKNNALL